MPNDWPLVPLGEALTLAIDAVPVDPSVSYPISGVYSFGRGLLARTSLQGSQTTYKVFHRLHKDDFVLSQLKGWEGALARVTPPFDGWFLSPQFATFRVMQNRLDIAYLEWYCKQSKVWEALRATARGMGARRDSVSPERFLQLTIPLPPLDEQRRIVARIEALAAKTEEARGLRRAVTDEAEQFLKSATERMLSSGSWVEVPLGNILRENSLNGLGRRPATSPPGVPILRISAATSRRDAVIEEDDFRYLEVSES